MALGAGGPLQALKHKGKVRAACLQLAQQVGIVDHVRKHRKPPVQQIAACGRQLAFLQAGGAPSQPSAAAVNVRKHTIVVAQMMDMYLTSHTTLGCGECSSQITAASRAAHLEQEEDLGGAVVGLELGARHGDGAVRVEGQHRLLVEAPVVLQRLLVHGDLQTGE